MSEPFLVPHLEVATPLFLGHAKLLALNLRPTGPGAASLVEEVLAMIVGSPFIVSQRGKRQRARLRGGIGTILGSVLREWAKGRPVFHLQKHQEFPSSSLVNEKAFDMLSFELIEAGLLADHSALHDGAQQDVEETSSCNIAGFFWPAAGLVAAAARHGVTPANVRKEFAGPTVTVLPRLGPLVDFRRLKSPQGVQRPARPSDRDSDVRTIRADVAEHNAFAAVSAVSGCPVAPRWRRVFTERLALGGRWTPAGPGDYLAMPKRERVASVTIDEEMVAEVDAEASHLSIIMGLLGVPLPDGDPYSLVLGIGARSAVKQWMTAALGSAQHRASSARDSATRLASWSAREVRQATVAFYPFMAHLTSALAVPLRLAELQSIVPLERLLPLRLQRLEAEAVTMAMRALRLQGALSLPAHDGLIVPLSRVLDASEALKAAYREVAGVAVRTSVLTATPKP